MQNGQIISTKQVGEEGTRSRTLINGTSLVSLSTETRSNNTTRTIGFMLAVRCRFLKLLPWEEVSMMDGNLVLALL